MTDIIKLYDQKINIENHFFSTISTMLKHKKFIYDCFSEISENYKDLIATRRINNVQILYDIIDVYLSDLVDLNNIADDIICGKY